MLARKVVVIGAGLSGFSAAAKLIENGFKDVVILEAENRTGGRIHSVPFADGTIDMGGQWCHGEKENVIYEMVHEHFNFGVLEVYEKEMDYVLSNGQYANQRNCTQLHLLLLGLYEQAEKTVKNESLGTFIEREFQKALELPEYENIEKTTADQLLAAFQKQMISFYASESWHDISVFYSQYGQECEGSQLLTWKKQGFKTVFDFITKKLPDPSKALDVESKVQFNKEVTNINSSADEVVITCADGTSFTADHVIVTASLGVLKDRHETLFTPKLPDEKIKAINSIGFGTLGKIFLEFDKPFWAADDIDFVGYAFLWTDDDLKAVKGTDKEWLVDVNGFYRIDQFPNIIEGIIGGKHMTTFETLSDERLIDDLMWLIEKFMGKTLPRPSNIKRTQWKTNRNFLGSYSYPSMDSEINEATPMVLAESIVNAHNKPVVLFAGEATHEKYSSYAHGAVASGWRAGDEVLKFYKPE